MCTAVPNKAVVMTVDQLGCVGQNENTSQYLLKWMPPDNINDFDLSHYEVNITGPSVKQTLSIRCIDTSTTFLLTPTTDVLMNISVSLVAVNQCGQRGIVTTCNCSSMVQLVRKCQSSAAPNSSIVAPKILALLWAALLLIATILSTP